MLEVNPELTWRDVQGILAFNAQKTDQDDSSWVTNAAGLSHSNKYGFGIVDAYAAVTVTRVWTNYGEERMLSEASGPVNASIPEDPTTPATSSIELSEGISAVESVSVYLDVDHYARGHLEITLTSPAGTESVLSPGWRPERNRYLSETWKLIALTFWGESSAGEWKLAVTEVKSGDIDGCVNLPYVFTDEAGEKSCEYATTITTILNCSDAEVQRSCCSCGGGQNASSVDSMLTSWRLVVYGQGDGGSLAMPSGPTPSSEGDESNSTATSGEDMSSNSTPSSGGEIPFDAGEDPPLDPTPSPGGDPPPSNPAPTSGCFRTDGFSSAYYVVIGVLMTVYI